MVTYCLAKDEKGTTMVIFALSITAMMMLCSLALDFGVVYYHASKAQNALDASILAAGQQLPVEENDTAKQESIHDLIEEYLEKNGIVDLSTLTINYSNVKDGKYMGMEAELTVNSKLHFAKIMGVNSIDVSKSAQVVILPSIKLTDVVPLAVKKGELDSHISNGSITNITLKYGGGGGTEGDFGAIDLDGVNGGGASDYEQWLANGFTRELTIGEGLYPVEPGNMAGPTASALNLRYSSCTHFQSYGGCSINRFEPTCPRVIKTPVVENITSKTVRIVAFAAFVLENPALSESGYVTGSFIRLILPGMPAESETQISSADYGIYALRLSR